MPLFYLTGGLSSAPSFLSSSLPLVLNTQLDGAGHGCTRLFVSNAADVSSDLPEDFQCLGPGWRPRSL